MRNEPLQFSNLNRQVRIKKSANTHYDLIVIGGGITGAGILLDAALRGMKAILIEKSDFASGTSSKSTKLIHGGLRYLKQMEFGLVRETGLERAVAHRNICHLVHPENMLLPIVENGTFSQFTAGLAIGVYDRLAKVERGQRRKKLSKQQVLNKEPLLEESKLKSGIIYSEYRTDDARLTMELIKSARRSGAEAFNYLEVNDFSYTGKNVSGIICEDKVTNEEVHINATHIVSSAGPWVDILRKKDNPKTETNLHLSKGVHIVFDKKDFNIQNSIYFDAFDGRMIFAIPRSGVVYVGTTDTSFDPGTDQLNCTKDDAAYLLNAVNTMFNIQLNIKDIKSTWSGLRPLIRQKGKGPTELSRKDEIFISDSGLISIAGGKLTGFRKMAKRVVDMVAEKLEQDFPPCKTKDYKIHQQPFSDYAEYLHVVEQLCKSYKDYYNQDIADLISNFGKDGIDILSETKDKGITLIESQLNYALQYESVYHPLDFLDRRTGWLFFNINKVKEHKEFITKRISNAFDFSSDWETQMLKESTNRYNSNSLKEIKEII
ncbi:MAG: glycerol-3-phosphate dehydrogenase/oxidase [Bacteroidota bacterium]